MDYKSGSNNNEAGENMSQTRVRAEILDADGSLYGERYDRVVLGAILAVFHVVSFKDTRDPAFPLYCDTIEMRINTFLSKFASEDAGLQECMSMKALRKIFIDAYRAKHPELFVTEGSMTEKAFALMINNGMRQIFLEIKKCYPDFFKRAIILANQSLFDDVIAQQKTFDVLVIASGSNRQTKSMDEEYSRCRLTNSIFADLETILYAFQEKLPHKKVQPCFISLPDVYERTQNPAWAMCHNLLSIYRAEKADYQVYHSGRLFDASKLTLMHLVVNHLHDTYPEAWHTHCFRDDNTVEELREFYRNHPDLLPYNTRLIMMHYENANLSAETIEGAGFFDNHYIQNVPKMMQMAKAAERSKKPNNLKPMKEDQFSVRTHLDVAKFKAMLAEQRAAFSVDGMKGLTKFCQ